ncbi:MAG: PaaI family thioesterase [Clostridiales bacterium]|nr:PaaI family thioesterase [Clostridiales bacterium]
MNLEQAKEYFKADKFATEAADIEIIELSDNYSKCSFEIKEKHLAAHGQVMGGAMFTLADFSFAVAANSGGRLTVTQSSNITFLANTGSGHLTAECRCIKDGKKTCLFETRVTDDSGRLLALVISNGMHIGS